METLSVLILLFAGLYYISWLRDEKQRERLRRSDDAAAKWSGHE